MYFMYLRKSRKDDELESATIEETLARHERTLLALAHKLDITIDKIYREVVSGETIAARPMMQQMLNDMESGNCDGVLVMEVERLARGNTMDQGFVSQAFQLRRVVEPPLMKVSIQVISHLMVTTVRSCITKKVGH